MTPLALALKGTAVLLTAAVVVRGLRRAPAAWRHAAWTASFSALVSLPVLSVLGPSWRVAVLPAETVATLVGPAGVALRPPQWSDGPTALAVLWAVGAALVALRWTAAHVAARRLIRRAIPVRSVRWMRAEREARIALGLGRPVRLLLSDRLDVPAAWGVLPARRTVLLPVSSETWDGGRRRAVLLHEMAHLARGDAWTQLVAQAAVAVHWFNPLAWVAYRRALAERELACDDAALRAGAAPVDYAGHLLALARTLRRGPLALSAVASMAQRSPLEARIVSILAAGRGRGPMTGRGAATAVAAAVSVAVLVAALDPVERPAERPAQTAPGPVEVAAAPAAVAPPVRQAPSARTRTAPEPEPARLAIGPDPTDAAPLRVEPAPSRPEAPEAAAEPAPPYVPLAYKSVDPDQIDHQVALLRATVAALRNLDPETVSHRSVDHALAAVPGLSDADRAALHAGAVTNLASARADAERRLLEAETAFERDRRGARGARGPVQ